MWIKKIKYTFIACLLLLPSAIFGWSAVGHKIVANIAYDHLTPEAKKAVDQLTFVPEKQYSGRSRFVYWSTWADWSRDRGDNRFRLWHYINLPISDHVVKTHPPHPINAVYGINHCQVVLRNAAASLEDQQTCLKLLIHVVGDIHQPLHAINRYSVSHPRGDHGGHSYLIRSKVADNLHAYWDRGLGKFTPFQRRQVTTGVRIWQYAEEIEERYPQEQIPARDRLPIEWAYEGRAIAESYVYQIPEKSTPTKDYHDKGVFIMEQRLALAGYRLAAMLNSIYTK
ncbi:MAG: S1/P1 nuclease [Gammaproteobacteria bacterium]|nr:S1/P1 nuclease [Gammaproteobacteria bacterium]